MCILGMRCRIGRMDEGNGLIHLSRPSRLAGRVGEARDNPAARVPDLPNLSQAATLESVTISVTCGVLGWHPPQRGCGVELEWRPERFARAAMAAARCLTARDGVRRKGIAARKGRIRSVAQGRASFAPNVAVRG